MKFLIISILISVVVAHNLPPDTGNTIKIGYTYGASGSEVPYGPEQFQIFQWTFNYTNYVLGGVNIGGTKYLLEQVVYDSASNCEDTLILYERLVTVDNVSLLLDTATPDCESGPIIAAKYGIPIINSGDYSFLFQNPKGNNWTFTLTPNALLFNQACLLDLYRAGARTAILALTPILVESFVLGVNFTIQQYMPGFKIINYEVIDETQIIDNTTYSNYLNPLINKWQKLNADVFMGGTSIAGAKNFLTAMRKAKYDVKGQFHYADIDTEVVRSQLGWLANGIITEGIFDPTFTFTDPVFGNTSNVVKLFTKAFGFQPSTFEFVNIMAVVVAYITLQNAQSTDPYILRETLFATNVTLVGGHLEFDQYGLQKYFNGYCFQITDKGVYSVINDSVTPNVIPHIIYPYVVTYPPDFFPKPNYLPRDLGLGIGLGVGVPLIILSIVFALYIRHRFHFLVFDRDEVKGETW